MDNLDSKITGKLRTNPMKDIDSAKYYQLVVTLIFAFIVVRLLSLGFYPLFDTTEARYGEIARIMVETQNWLTPQFDYQQPFWGKPPLHTWLSALSFRALGISELTARLPHFLAGMAALALLYHFAKQFYSKSVALVAALILISSIGFVIAIGMVMTDAVLTLSVVLAMCSFWQNYCQKSPLTGNLFFTALAMGMLVKGPVAVVIIGIALVTWSIANRCFINAIKSLPWLSGLFVFSLLTLPWYLLAEAATPGFLEYFLWGEHVQRFLEAGWKGDLYGTAHDEVKGTIWLFALAMAFPWSFAALFFVGKQFRQTKNVGQKDSVQASPQQKQLNNYLIAWLLAPLLLFTMAGNILPAYVMPGIPAFTLWLAPKFSSFKAVIANSLLSFCLVCAAIIFVAGGFISKTSQVQLLGESAMTNSAPIYYWKKRPFSARFYTSGQAQLVSDEMSLREILAQPQAFLLAGRSRDFPVDILSLTSRCKLVRETNKYSLLSCN